MSTENVPPVKMKQATLNFFKPSPTFENKGKSNSKAKKRKSHSPLSIDSPSKTAKLSKPLVVISESANSPSKHPKSCKSSIDHDINDHEVSSSSEADNAPTKTTSGKCCLMDRFVSKLPKATNQEISSTNDTVDEEVQMCVKQTDDVYYVVIDDDKEQDGGNKSSLKVEEVPSMSTPKISKCQATKDKGKSPKSKHKKHADNEEVHAHAEGKTTSESQSKEEKLESSLNESANGNSSISFSTPLKLDESKTSFNTSLNDISFVSENELVSTPSREDTTNGKLVDAKTPKTAATDIKVSEDKKQKSLMEDDSGSVTPQTSSSKKRGKKIDPAKKAEKEAEKQRLKDEREQQRSEKKRKLEEEKAEKDRQKLIKKEAKEKEKQEKLEKLQKEKEEKEKIKEEERKKKEKERLIKEEEKQKRQAVQEAKLEEKRKKEEEKRQKEEEKLREEEEKRKKAEKVKNAFQSFFIKPKEDTKQVVPKVTSGAFSPFEVKKNMYLAPATRRNALSEETKATVDNYLGDATACTVDYLKELRSKVISPKKTGKILRTNPEPAEDVEVVHDPKALQKVQHKVKLLQFHTDYRPPYYGTWRKAPKLSGRNPWKKDESFFDYEVDSDEEWEEEEPGESLSCSDGEEEKGDKAEDEEEEEEDGWMVPHGYLSEDEGCNEDDEITPEKLKLQQLAKAKAWELEQKKKLQAAPLLAVGCFFEHSPSNLMTGDVRLLYEFRGVVLCPTMPIPTCLFGCKDQEDEPDTPDKQSTKSSQKGVGAIKKPVPDEAMPDLIQMVHGNVFGIKRLIRDFRVFWFKKETQSDQTHTDVQEGGFDISIQDKEKDESFLNESTQEIQVGTDGKQTEGKEEKKDDGHKCSISKRQLEMKINAIAVRDKRPGFHKTCWYVHEAVLKEFNLEGLVSNSLVPPEPVPTPPAPQEQPLPSVKDQRSIMDFALSKEELAKREIVTPNKVVENPLPKTPQSDQKSIMDFATSKQELGRSEPKPKGTENMTSSVVVSPCIAKGNRKAAGQMSIMNFAKSGSSKSNAAKAVSTPEPVPMDLDDQDVIIIKSSTDAEMISEKEKSAEKERGAADSVSTPEPVPMDLDDQDVIIIKSSTDAEMISEKEKSAEKERGAADSSEDSTAAKCIGQNTQSLSSTLSNSNLKKCFVKLDKM